MSTRDFKGDRARCKGLGDNRQLVLTRPATPLLAKDVGLLASVLPNHDGARLLGLASQDFLQRANAKDSAR